MENNDEAMETRCRINPTNKTYFTLTNVTKFRSVLVYKTMIQPELPGSDTST